MEAWLPAHGLDFSALGASARCGCSSSSSSATAWRSMRGRAFFRRLRTGFFRGVVVLELYGVVNRLRWFGGLLFYARVVPGRAGLAGDEKEMVVGCFYAVVVGCELSWGGSFVRTIRRGRIWRVPPRRPGASGSSSAECRGLSEFACMRALQTHMLPHTLPFSLGAPSCTKMTHDLTVDHNSWLRVL